jgi:hypothetical protein
MDASNAHVRPVARKEDLIVQQLGDETLVYDLSRHKAHCLNATAATIWRQCDGNQTVADIARHAGADLDVPCDDAVVLYALAHLQKNHLLEGRISADLNVSLKRRAALRTLALGGLALPLIASIPSPTRAQAASCGGTGAPCSSNSQCCAILICCQSAGNTCQTPVVCLPLSP